MREEGVGRSVRRDPTLLAGPEPLVSERLTSFASLAGSASAAGTALGMG